MSQSLLTSAATKWQRAVFLDRDGVLNRALEREGKPYPPTTLAEFAILPEVPAALAKLKAASMDLGAFSLDTVKTFASAAQVAGFKR